MLGAKQHSALFPAPNARAPNAGASVETEDSYPSYLAQTTKGSRLQQHARGTAMMANDRMVNDDTHNSGESGLSNLSALDNPTDDFDRVIAQHARDAKRLNDALHGNTQGKAFSRARTGRRQPMGRAIEDMAGEDVKRERHNSVPEPPVTVPREWGTRGARKDRWLDRLTGQQEDQDVKDQGEGDGTIIRHGKSYNGDQSPIDEWEAVADRPLPSVEDTPPSMRKHQRLQTSPTSLRHLNSSNADGYFDDDDDFGTGSMIASTPVFSRHNRKIDQLSLLEIEDLQKREVANNEPNRIAEFSANGNALRKTSSSRIRQRVLAEDPKTNTSAPPVRPTTAPGRTPSPSKIPKRRQSLYGNKENVPVNGDRTAGFKASETVGVDRTVGTRSNVPQRPGHERNKSMNLLRTLARVSSMSPSPGKNRAAAPRPLSRGSSSGSIKASSILAGPQESGGSSDSSPQSVVEKRAVSAESQQSKEFAADRESEPAQDRPKEEPPAITQDDVEQTPTRSTMPDQGKTPVVTGAWVDTQLEIKPDSQTDDLKIDEPSGVAVQDFSQPSTSPGEVPLRSLSEPKLPRSALEAIVQQDRDATERQYGDSTMNSLEGIIRQNGDGTDLETTIEVESTAQEIVEAMDAADDGQSLTQAEKDRRQELLAMEAMNRHLRLARTSLKEADRGMRRVENRFDHLDDGKAGPPEKEYKPAAQAPNQVITKIENAPKAAEATTSSIAPAAHTSDKHCPTCGTPYRGVWRALWTEFTDCFYVRSPASPIGIRLTRLGLFCLITTLWYLLESSLWYALPARTAALQNLQNLTTLHRTLAITALTLLVSAFYCHQGSAPYMLGTGCDPHSPQFPLVIPTLIFRPVRWLWRPVLDSGLAYWHSFFPAEPYPYYTTWSGERIRQPWPHMQGDSAWDFGVKPYTAEEALALERPAGYMMGGAAGGVRKRWDVPKAGQGQGQGKVGAPVGKAVGEDWATATQAAVSTAGTVAAAAAETTRRFAESWRDAVDEVGSMWDDEPV